MIAGGRTNAALAGASLVLAGLMLALPFLVPLHRSPIGSFYGEWSAFVLGLLAAGALAGARAWTAPRFPLAALFALGALALVLAHAALGRVPYAERALTAALYLAWAALLVWLGDHLRRELGLPKVGAALAWFALSGAVLGALAALLQYYRVPAPEALVFPKVTGAATGNLGQSNHLASHCAIGLAALAYLYATRRLAAAPAAGAAALIFSAGTLSGSRSLWLYLAGAAALAALWQRLRPEPAHARLALVCLAALPAFAAFNALAALPALQPPEGGVATPLGRLFASASGASIRLELWREAWRFFEEAPLAGIGFGAFAWNHFARAGSLLAPDPFDDVLCDHAHNLIFHVLAEAGLLGGALVLAAAALWIAGLRRHGASPELWWVAAVATTIALHSLLEYPLWYAYFLGPAALFAGLGSAHSVPLAANRALRFAVAAALALGLWNAAAVLGEYVALERALSPRRLHALQGEAVPQWAGELMLRHEHPVLRPHVEYALLAASPVDENALEQKLALAARVMRFAPTDEIAYKYALLLALGGRHEQARGIAARALERYPGAFDEFRGALASLAQRFPGRFEPLLEWSEAAARRSAAKSFVEPAH